MLRETHRGTFILIASKTITYTLFDIIRIKITLYNELLQ